MKKAYEALKKEINRKSRKAEQDQSGFGVRCFPLIEDLYNAAHKQLSGCGRIALDSKVAGKSYFSFESKISRSRPVNSDLFDTDADNAFGNFHRILEGKRHELTSDEITRSVYIVTMTCCGGRDAHPKAIKRHRARFLNGFVLP